VTQDLAGILIATKNRPKAEELAALLSRTGLGDCLRPLSLADWEKDHHPLPEPQEGANDFVENALIKARSYARATGLLALADDSGLSVAALGGAPGVLSARYGGSDLDDPGRCRLLLANLSAASDRRAFFTSVLALARPDGEALFWRGQLHGLISREPLGAHGFGYDPVFFLPESGLTLAQLTTSEKNAVSHRAVAARAFLADSGRIRHFLSSGSRDSDFVEKNGIRGNAK